MKIHRRATSITAAALGVLAAIAYAGAQDRISAMPGYDRFTKMQPLIANAYVSGGARGIQWAADGRSVGYSVAGDNHVFDLAGKSSRKGTLPANPGGNRGGRGVAFAGGGGGGENRGGLEQEQSEMPAAPVAGCPPIQTQTARGRQAYCIVSPDGRAKAFYRARNLWVAAIDGTSERQVTRDGSIASRIKYATGSWVYGEELGQTTSIWWSPDSKKVGYYRFDEGPVKDFYVQMQQTSIQDAMDVEAYPKAGADNPVVDVFVFDIASAAITHIDARDGKPFDNNVVGHYVYGIQWSPDSSELFLERANRRQQIVEFAACSPTSGACRVIVHEEWNTGWLNAGVDTRISPYLAPRWLADGKRFIWESERNGWLNYYLYDTTGKLLNPITRNTDFEADSIVKIDEANNVMFYTARDGDNYMKLQLHRVGLDGSNDVRLTSPAFTHDVSAAAISPDNAYFVDVYQTYDTPPATQLVSARDGTVVAQLAASDMTQYKKAGFRKTEQYSYLAADGKTRLYGQISFPSNFDRSKKYPTLVSVYGGPVLQNAIPTEQFVPPNARAEYGFLTVLVSYRGVPGTGKRAADSMYLKLGVSDIDDMVAGIKALWNRPYFDRKRVGMYGTSYGGYTAATAMLRYPDVVTVASASSPVTDWRHYDSIYTERFMWMPQENAKGYDDGSAVKLASNLRGRLLIYYGTADNNVHQNNSMQLIQALQRAGKSFEVQVGPDQPHTGVNGQRMMEFFIENLIMRPERILAPEE